MPKTSREQIDKDEKKILALLQQNSNESIDRIAKHCGFSRQKVWRTIKSLEKNGFIWGYTAIIDDEKNDQKHYMMLIKKTLKPLDKKIIDSLTSIQIEDFVSSPEVTIESSCFVHGNVDWIISFTAPNLRQAIKFSNMFNSAFAGIIQKIELVETLFFVRKHHIFNPNMKKLREFL